MKQLACEMCGSTDMIKQDGVFVCQSCGCKYSVEEAKKMMVDGTVKVQGIVQIDKEQEVQNLRILAQRAKETGDSAAAEKYYNQLLLALPKDWEATFYATYYTAHNIKIAQIGSGANRVAGILDSVFELITETISTETADGILQQRTAMLQVDGAVKGFGAMLSQNVLQNYGSTREDFLKAIDKWLVPILSMYIVLGDCWLKFVYTGNIEFALRQAAEAYNLVAGAYSMLNFAATSNAMELLSISEERLRKWEELEMQAKQKSIDRYWTEHQEEKRTLEKEKAILLETNAVLESELKAIAGKKEMESLAEQINNLIKERYELGPFKGKEKVAIQEKIDRLIRERKQLEEKVQQKEKSIREKIGPIKSRIEEIDEELTMER